MQTHVILSVLIVIIVISVEITILTARAVKHCVGISAIYLRC